MNDQNNGSGLQHITVAITVVAAWLVGFLFSFPLLEKVFDNPVAYFGNSFSILKFQFLFVALSFIVTGTLIAYIIYLLLTSKTRVDLIVRGSTKWLALSREQFRRLYEGAPIPYLMLDAKGEIHNPNNAALRFFGVVPEEIDGKNLFSFHAEDEEDRADRLAELHKSNIPINREEIRMVTKSGEEKWVLLSIFDIKNPLDQKSVGLASIFDITEEKRLDQAKTEFVSLASHQLRAPIATIKWLADMLLSGDIGALSEKQRDYLTRIFNVNHEMVDLVDTLLNVSRIEIGTLAIDIQSTNVAELCRSILLELAPQIEKKNLRMVEEYGGLFEDIQSDPKLLRIVIHNLVSNAVKYTPDGGTITITLDNSGGEKHIIVTDTGLGIPRDEQNRLFTKLFRASNVRRESTSQGTGLGLYLVQSLMQTLGGSISFVSEENKGSRFTLTLG